ncbi:hypothetical protein [Actinomadura parmotrematis]|uniref:Guanylate cyclase domain-containing protein n=1 Tax=Actinomadura parmotrematis TaxID=2864039 RepID=A0ABS7FYK7_9ACTN|nr:hypothetical protein [Actinomadura parmotrematis]MBW8485523.1 hypothetical protein [Actinomadura parmotrematis]
MIDDRAAPGGTDGDDPRPRPPAGPAPARLDPGPYGPWARHTLLATDIVGFGARHRDDRIALHLRRAMYTALAEALAMTGLILADCHHEDRGDGALVVAPAAWPAALLLDPLAHHLTASLRALNALAGDAARLRLRVAVHAGLVQRDQHGLAGRALVDLFRLLEAPAFKEAIAASPADLGVAVSDEFYTETVRSGLVNRAAYSPLPVVLKEARATARVWFPPRYGPGRR